MLTMDDIVREGHPALREKSVEVDLPPTDEELAMAKKMLEFLKTAKMMKPLNVAIYDPVLALQLHS